MEQMKEAGKLPVLKKKIVIVYMIFVSLNTCAKCVFLLLKYGNNGGQDRYRLNNSVKWGNLNSE